MEKIIVFCQPFAPTQQICAYKDGNKIATYESSVDNANATIVKAAQENNIQTIQLAGPKQYCTGIKRHLEEDSVSKFNISLTIELI